MSATMASIDVERLISDISMRPAIWDRNFNGRHNKAFLEDTWDELAELHSAPKKIIKAKWKGLRDNFRIQWKMIPRDDQDNLLIAPEDFTGTKWQYYRQLLFLADNMGKSRPAYPLGSQNNTFNNESLDENNSSNNFDDIRHAYEPAIEIPSEEEVERDVKPQINNRVDKEAKAMPQLKVVDVHTLVSGRLSNISANTSSSSHVVANGNSNPNKRKRIEEATTTAGTSITSDEYPSVSSPTNVHLSEDYHFLMSLYPYVASFNGAQKLKIRMKIQKLIFKELYKDDIEDDK